MDTRSQARRYFLSLSPFDRGVLMDQFILGDFDWMDWFDDKPTKAFIQALYTEGARWEEGQ